MDIEIIDAKADPERFSREFCEIYLDALDDKIEKAREDPDLLGYRLNWLFSERNTLENLSAERNWRANNMHQHIAKIKDKIENTNFFVAISEDGTTLGTGALRNIKMMKRFAYMDSLFVRPEYQGKGIGSALCDEREDCAKKRGGRGVIILSDLYVPTIGFHKNRWYRPIMTDKEMHHSREYMQHYILMYKNI